MEFCKRNMMGWLVTARKGDVFCVFLMATFFMWLEIDGNRTSQQLIFGVGDLKSMVAFFVENDAVLMGQKAGTRGACGVNFYVLSINWKVIVYCYQQSLRVTVDG